ncbi:hypothetical protein Taro_026264 [Colocasia esculenta]|uniref:Uncharacterized protein n=1 Tax=Colocasia esculenta TaxID=4460 RepID=A0A843VN33_COLES|nr:hypothetical protein [Colocasia esculenta]
MCRARDLYVNDMTGIADRVSSRGISMHPSRVPGGYAGRFARSGNGGSSSSSGDDYLRELVCTASSHSSPGTSPAGGRTAVVPSSQSVGMARNNDDDAVDLYVNSMTGIADRASSRGISRHPSGVPGGYVGRFARSDSGGGGNSNCNSNGSSSDDDLRELVHAASSHSSSGASPADGRTAMVLRSQSAGMTRIDEDGPCDFGGDALVIGIIPKSRSYEVPKSRVGVMPITVDEARRPVVTEAAAIRGGCVDLETAAPPLSRAALSSPVTPGRHCTCTPAVGRD